MIWSGSAWRPDPTKVLHRGRVACEWSGELSKPLLLCDGDEGATGMIKGRTGEGNRGCESVRRVVPTPAGLLTGEGVARSAVPRDGERSAKAVAPAPVGATLSRSGHRSLTICPPVFSPMAPR